MKLENKQRRDAIFSLRNNAQSYSEEKALFDVIKSYFPTVLENPEMASKAQIKKYNDLVRNSNVPLPRREKYFFV